MKKYSGPMAFAMFLSEFEKGSRTFSPKEFPKNQSRLERIGIRYITVEYSMKGHREVIAILRKGPGRVPKEIVTCWDH